MNSLEIDHVLYKYLHFTPQQIDALPYWRFEIVLENIFKDFERGKQQENKGMLINRKLEVEIQ
jgi:hypothetical protein